MTIGVVLRKNSMAVLGVLFDLLPFLIMVVIAYLLGSIPFGLVFSKLFGAGDIRQVGSGNIGATNVLRSGHKGLAFATLLFDGGKGFAALWMAPFVLRLFDSFPTPESARWILLWTAWWVILGHIFPVWLGFKGGKGVATVLGCLLYLSPETAGAVSATWIVVVGCSRYSSLGALISAALLPVYGFFFESGVFVLWSMGTLALIVFTHRDNIKRLQLGKESKIGQKSRSVPPPSPSKSARSSGGRRKTRP